MEKCFKLVSSSFKFVVEVFVKGTVRLTLMKKVQEMADKAGKSGKMI
jgi:hypothetical protein